MSGCAVDRKSFPLLLPAATHASNVRVILTWQPPTGAAFQKRGTHTGGLEEFPSVFVQFCAGKRGEDSRE